MHNLVQKRWVSKAAPDNEIITELQREFQEKQDRKLNHILVTLMAQRNIATYELARKFFNPDEKDLYDPFLMKDMDKAVDRLKAAIDNQEKILLYGDYDVDGTTAVSIMYNYLS